MKDQEIKELSIMFYESLSQLSLNERYGHLLDDPEVLEILKKIFILMMSEKKIGKMILILKKHDEASYIHSFDMFVLACVLEIQMQVFDFHFVRGAFLHDIGKTCIPREILQKNSKLTTEEYETIKSHTTFGFEILQLLSYHKEAELALCHHEKMDETGYPNKSKGTEIKSEIRLLTIMDVYSALTLKRPYKRAFTNDEAFSIMKDEEDSYDTEYLDGFILKVNQKIINKH